MNRITLLEKLKEVTENAVKDLILPVAPQKGDTELKYRAPDVYLMRLPDVNSAMKKVPYVLIQFALGEDKQEPRERPESSAMIRFVCAVYHNDGQEGALSLLNVMERIRIALLRNPVVGGQFVLDLEAGYQAAIDYDDIGPYYKGEMVNTWSLPPVEREDVRKCL